MTTSVAVLRASRARGGPTTRRRREVPPCVRYGPGLWFSLDPDEIETAKSMCRSCPLRDSCLAGALERHEPAGVWGGELLQRGVVLGFKRSRGRPPVVRSTA